MYLPFRASWQTVIRPSTSFPLPPLKFRTVGFPAPYVARHITSTVGRRRSQKSSLPCYRFARLRLTLPRSDHVQGSGSPRGQSPYSLAGAFVSAVPQALGSARFVIPAPANATTA